MLGACLVAVALFLFWAFDVVAYQQIPKYNQAITERQAILQEHKAILENITSLNAEYQKRSASVQRFSSTVPTQKSTAQLIVSLDAAATQAGIHISDLGMGETKQVGEAAGPSTVSITMAMTGTYAGLLLFLSNLEQNVRIIDVQSISVQPQAGSGILNFDLRATTYFIK